MDERILFAGGCHLTGYLVDAVNSFPQIWLSHLQDTGVAVTSDFVTHVPLTRPERIVEKCRSFRPTSVILQVGHYELSREFSALLPRIGVARKKKASKPQKPVLHGVSRRSMRWRLRCVAKCALDFTLCRPLVDHSAFEKLMERLCRALAAENIKSVIMLGPLPSIDPVVNRNRRKAMACYRRLSTEYGFTYCDMSDLQPLPADHLFGRAEFYADPVHLGIAGHRAVADRLRTSLREVYANPVCASAR